MALRGDSGLLALATKPTRLRESHIIKCNLSFFIVIFLYVGVATTARHSQIDLDLRLPRSEIRKAGVVKFSHLSFARGQNYL